MTSYKWNCIPFIILLCTMCILREVGGHACPKGWAPGPDGMKCFKAMDTLLSWSDALNNCISQKPKGPRASLANILDLETNRLISYLVITSDNEFYWIGLNDIKKEGEYVWRNNLIPMGYKNWGENQPNNYENQDGVAITSNGTWYDEIVSSSYKSICELSYTNECNYNNGGCSHGCRYKLDGHSCECYGNYILNSSNSRKCDDIDECIKNNGGCNQLCINVPGSFKCGCFTGYALIGSQCVDIDECSVGNGGCTHNCTNTVGSFNCICNAGFELYSTRCIDINECEYSRGGCDQICTNTVGSFKCSCLDGFTADGFHCFKQFDFRFLLILLLLGIIASLIYALRKYTDEKKVDGELHSEHKESVVGSGESEESEENKYNEEEEGRDEQRKASNETDETAEEAE